METYSLKWNLHFDHLGKVVNEMFLYNHFTDVTIVCDDQKMVNAHKFLLSGSSPVMKDIIDSLSENDSVIDLRGIQSEDMESILKFLYTGNVSFPQSRSESFLNVARYLDIKEIYKIFDIDNVAENYYEDIVILDVTTADDEQSATEENVLEEYKDAQCYSEEEEAISENQIEYVTPADDNEQSPAQENGRTETKNKDTEFYSQEEGANYENQIEASSDSKQCEFCNFDFKNESSLDKHLKLVHHIYMCTFENCEYYFEKQAEQHYKTAHKIMKQHINSVHHQNRKFSCPIKTCDFVTDKEKRLRRHTLKHRIFNCKFCDDQFTIKASLRKHTYMKHFQNCIQEEKFEVRVNQNKKIILQTNALQCTDCHTVFEGRKDFNFHRQSIHGKNPCPDDNCDYIPKGRTALHVHNKTKHLRSPVDNVFYECNECHLKFTQQSSLETHIQTHETHCCKECNYKTKNLQKLKKHSDVHLDAQTFLCPDCNYKTTKPNNLKIHSDRHRAKTYSYSL